MPATSNLVSGFAAGMSSGPGEYAFATRFRHKLVLSYLSQQRLHPAFKSMVQKTDAHMCGDHLRRLVVRGQWVDALEYLHRFNSRRTVASNALHFFLHTLSALANVAAGARNGSVKSGAHTHGMALSTVICRSAKLCSLVKAMLASPAQCAALDSKPARLKASYIAHLLAREDPDLYRLMQLPIDGQLLLPHHLIPIINPRPRRHVKRLSGRRAPGPAIAKLYLNKRRSLLHSSSPPNTSALMDESLDRVASLIGECIKAGKPQKQLQSVGRVSGAPASSQFMSGSLTNQAKHSGISSAQNSVLQLAQSPEAMPVVNT